MKKYIAPIVFLALSVIFLLYVIHLGMTDPAKNFFKGLICMFNGRVTIGLSLCHISWVSALLTMR